MVSKVMSDVLCRKGLRSSVIICIDLCNPCVAQCCVLSKVCLMCYKKLVLPILHKLAINVIDS